MKMLLIVLIAWLLPVAVHADDSNISTLHYPKAEIHDILALYERLTATRVFIALDLQASVTIITDRPITIPFAIQLIRTTLLEQYGIELRDIGHGETLAGWSTDPKYPRRSDPPVTQAERDILPKSRVRIIK